MKINIIGAGTWGVTLAVYLSKAGHKITIYHRETKNSIKLKTTYKHLKLPDLKIPRDILFRSIANQSNIKDLTFIAVPTHAIIDSLKTINVDNCNLVILSKGFDFKTGLLPTDNLVNTTNINLNKIAVLSGPNHAEEIADNKPTATTIASLDSVFNKKLQILLSSKTLRVYTSNDINGVQLGGAVKNVIAIAAGICSGLNLGDNALASLITRGMNELLELSSLFNVKSKTLYGLSGLGDLIGTCYSIHSRNRKLGLLISKGNTLINAQNSIGMAVEGINSARKINNLILENNLNMPICSEVYSILFEEADPAESFSSLMVRDLKNES